MNEDITSIGKIIERVFTEISIEDSNNAVSVANKWKEIVSRIKPSQKNTIRNENIGNNIADHSRVVDIKNGVLLVEADHPGWISLLQFYKNFILKGFKMSRCDININNIVFKLSGMKGELCETIDEKERLGKKLIKKQIEEDERGPVPAESELLKKREKKELPPELKPIFEDLEKSMLTNSDK